MLIDPTAEQRCDVIQQRDSGVCFLYIELLLYPNVLFIKTHCLVAYHMAREIVVLFKNPALCLALPLPGSGQLKAVLYLSLFLMIE